MNDELDIAHMRITKRSERGGAEIGAKEVSMRRLYKKLDFAEATMLTVALNRLAAYEDTGLTPEEISELITTLSAVRHRVDDIEVLKNILKMEAKNNETD